MKLYASFIAVCAMALTACSSGTVQDRWERTNSVPNQYKIDRDGNSVPLTTRTQNRDYAAFSYNALNNYVPRTKTGGYPQMMEVYSGKTLQIAIEPGTDLCSARPVLYPRYYSGYWGRRLFENNHGGRVELLGAIHALVNANCAPGYQNAPKIRLYDWEMATKEHANRGGVMGTCGADLPESSGCIWEYSYYNFDTPQFEAQIDLASSVITPLREDYISRYYDVYGARIAQNKIDQERSRQRRAAMARLSNTRGGLLDACLNNPLICGGLAALVITAGGSGGPIGSCHQSCEASYSDPAQINSCKQFC